MDNSKITILLKQLAKLHLREQDPEEAAKRLSRLLELNPTNKKFLAQLIIAYAQVYTHIINFWHICIIIRDIEINLLYYIRNKNN